MLDIHDTVHSGLRKDGLVGPDCCNPYRSEIYPRCPIILSIAGLIWQQLGHDLSALFQNYLNASKEQR